MAFIFISGASLAQVETYESCKAKLDPIAEDCRKMAEGNDDANIVFAICVYKKFSEPHKACISLLERYCQEGPAQTLICEAPEGVKSKVEKAKKSKAVR